MRVIGIDAKMPVFSLAIWVKTKGRKGRVSVSVGVDWSMTGIEGGQQ